MKKYYSIQQLADILGCSRTAIQKKIKTVDDVTGMKRYKNRFEVVMENDKMHIVLTDEELQQEKMLSKGFNNVAQNGYTTTTNEDIIEIEPVKEEIKQDELFKFTERYINDFKTLSKEMYNELQERDKQILLLTTSENSKDNELYKVRAKNKTLKQRNVIITLVLTVVSTLLMVAIIGFVVFANVTKNGTETEETSATAPGQIEQIKSVEVQKPVTKR